MNRTLRLKDRYQVEMTHRSNGTKKPVIVLAADAERAVKRAEHEYPDYVVVGGIYHARIYLVLG